MKGKLSIVVKVQNITFTIPIHLLTYLPLIFRIYGFLNTIGIVNALFRTKMLQNLRINFYANGARTSLGELCQPKYYFHVQTIKQ